MNFDGAASEIKTFVHEFGHLYGAPDHYGISAPSTTEMNTENGTQDFDEYCIYGEKKDFSSVVSNLTLCDGCRKYIESNRNKYNHN